MRKRQMVSDDTKKHILRYIQVNPVHKCLISDIQDDSGLARDTVVKYVEVLEAEGKIRAVKVANARAYEPAKRRKHRCK